MPVKKHAPPISAYTPATFHAPSQFPRFTLDRSARASTLSINICLHRPRVGSSNSSSGPQTAPPEEIIRVNTVVKAFNQAPPACLETATGTAARGTWRWWWRTCRDRVLTTAKRTASQTTGRKTDTDRSARGDLRPVIGSYCTDMLPRKNTKKASTKASKL
jgi:hypothetical protein